MKRKARTLGVLIGCLAAVVASGCAGDELATPTVPAATAPSTTMPASTVPAAAPFEPSRRYRWGLEDETDGSEAELVVELGDVVPAGDTGDLPPAFQEFLASCQVDPQRDALLPLRMRVTNFNQGSFGIEPTVQLLVSSMARMKVAIDQAVSAATVYRDIPDCSGSADPLISVTMDEIQPLNERRHSWLMVLHGFYSPAVPEGDVEGFADLDAGLLVSGPNRLPWRPTCVEGPQRKMWTGAWRPFFRALFPLLDATPSYGGTATDLLPRC